MYKKYSVKMVRNKSCAFLSTFCHSYRFGQKINAIFDIFGATGEIGKALQKRAQSVTCIYLKMALP